MRFRLFTLFTAGLFVFFLTKPAEGQQNPDSQQPAEDEIIAEINNWRIDLGLWPLAENDTLHMMAVNQANYLLTTDIPQHGGDFHADNNGEYPRQRSSHNPYNWPNYGSPETSLVGENVAVGTVRSSMTFWQNSAVHTQATTNPDYREVGVAAMPLGSDYVFVVVFGGRPNVLPVLYNPLNNSLFLSNDTSRFAPRSEQWIDNASTVQMLDASGQPMGDAQPWQANMLLPANTGNTFTVRFSDGETQVDTPVTLDHDIAAQMVHNQVVEAGHETAADMGTVDEFTTFATPVGEGTGAEFLGVYPDQNRDVAFELLGEMNAFRLENNVWPLLPNVTLESLALRQAEYLRSETDIDHVGDLHADADLKYVRERAEHAPFSWPNYGSAQETIIGENIAIGDTGFAMKFWKQSPTDHVNLLDPEYREAGIAALPYGDGEFILVAVFAARPNVLPIQYLPEQHKLILSNELVPYAGTSERVIGNVTRILIFDDQGRPLTGGWTSWHETIDIPEMDTDRIFVICSDGFMDVLVEVNFDERAVVLPENADFAASMEETAIAPLLATTPTPTTFAPANNAFVMVTNTPSAP